MTRTAWVALVVLSLGWGTRGVATRAAFEHDVGALTLVGMRLVIAAVFAAAIFALVTRSVRVRREVLVPGTVMAMTNMVVPFLFFTLAYEQASAGFVGLMAALTPLATAILAHLVLPGEELNRARLVGMLVAVAGVAAMLVSGDSGLSIGGRPLLAAALSMPAVAAFSFSTVYAKQRASVLKGWDVLVVQFAVGALVAAVPMLLVEGLPRLDVTAWLLLPYLGVFSTVIPLLLFYRVLVDSTAGQASLAGYIVPVVSVVAGVILLGEQVQVGLVLGGVGILTGVIMADRAGPRIATRSA